MSTMVPLKVLTEERIGQPPSATPEESSMEMGQPPESGGFNLLSPLVTGQAVSQITLFRQWSHDIQDRNTTARLASYVHIMGDAGTTLVVNIGPFFTW